ncbi:MAG: RDD family protein [Coprothermobacterota bacterium]|nr:RDD family protein [Coprothermobacterota bacterium]
MPYLQDGKRPLADIQEAGGWIYEYAGFGVRLLAALLDLFFLAVVQLFLLLLIEPRFFQMPQIYLAGQASLGVYLFGSLSAWLYSAIFESSAWQATPGKRLLGIRVMNERGEALSFWLTSLRFVGKVISVGLLGAGFLLILFTPRKQALHDLLVGSLVVRILRPPEAELTKLQKSQLPHGIEA